MPNNRLGFVIPAGYKATDFRPQSQRGNFLFLKGDFRTFSDFFDDFAPKSPFKNKKLPHSF